MYWSEYWTFRTQGRGAILQLTLFNCGVLQRPIERISACCFVGNKKANPHLETQYVLEKLNLLSKAAIPEDSLPSVGLFLMITRIKLSFTGNRCYNWSYDCPQKLVKRFIEFYTIPRVIVSACHRIAALCWTMSSSSRLVYHRLPLWKFNIIEQDIFGRGGDLLNNQININSLLPLYNNLQLLECKLLFTEAFPYSYHLLHR